MIRYYSLMFVIAFGLGWYLTKKIYEREEIAIEKLDTLFIWTVFATLIGARLGHVFFYDWEYYRNNLSEILLPFRFNPDFEFTGFQGLASHGAAIAVITTMYFYSKNIIHKPILWILDRITIPVAIGGFFVRIGNFFNSEIVGTATDSPLGIVFLRDAISRKEAIQRTGIQDTNAAYNAIATDPTYAFILEEITPKHPAQLYEAAGYLIVFAILLYSYWKTDAREKVGYLFGLFLILLWGIRFLVEFVKESQGGFENMLGLLSTGQWLSLPFIVIGIFLVIFADKPLPTKI